MDTVQDRKRVLIVGAGGFIGGFIAAEALRRGLEVWAGIRESTSRRYLTDSRIKFLILDYDSPSGMAEAMQSALPEGNRWDYVVYNLGATKCTNFSDFNRINFNYLRSFTEAMREAGKIPDRFLYMSSLSAVGPGDEKNYTPIGTDHIPHPNTRYGLSKIKAETYLQTCSDIPWIIFRPTGVYGPHEQDYLMMVRSIDRHMDFGVGYRRQMLTFIYVEDLASAIFDALASDRTLHRKYNIAEGKAYTQTEFRKITAHALGRGFVIPLRLPLWAAYLASVVAEKYGIAKMQPSTLNTDKFKIMRQRNWDCTIDDAVRDFGFTPRFPLERGMEKTVEAYRASLAAEKARKKDMKKKSKKGAEG